MSFKKIAAMVLVFALALSTLAMTGCSASSGGNFKVGFVYIGVPGDGGWTYEHDQGRKFMAKELGMKEEDTIFIENVAESADAETAIESLVKKGCKLIFTTSFGYMDYTLNVANKYPDVKFEHCSGYKTSENMANYFGRIHQGSYLAGIAAGAATKNGKLGFVAAFPIPEVIRNINAYALGARSVNPDATVQVVWTKTWYDPGTEKEAAESLIDAGCDVIGQHQDTPEPVKAAEKAGVFSTGYDSPMGKYAPNGYLTGANWNFGPFYTERAKAVKDGTWKSQSYWGGLNDNIVVLDEFGKSVSEETKALIAAKKAEIVSGSWDVFTGPIKDQSGAVKIAEGQKMTDEEQLAMDWLVEGVLGKVSE